jgi:hypothetical protein
MRVFGCLIWVLIYTGSLSDNCLPIEDSHFSCGGADEETSIASSAIGETYRTREDLTTAQIVVTVIASVAAVCIVGVVYCLALRRLSARKLHDGETVLKHEEQNTEQYKEDVQNEVRLEI